MSGKPRGDFVRAILVPVASPLHNKASVLRVLSRVTTSLGDLFTEVHELVTNVSEVDVDYLKKFNIVAVFPITGGTEEMIISAANCGEISLVLYHDTMNSLPAVLEALPIIRSRRSRVFVMNVDELTEIRKLLHVIKFCYELSDFRLGVVGPESPWLVASRVDRSTVRSVLGIEVLDLSIDELLQYMSEVPKEDIAAVVSKVRSCVERVYVDDRSIENCLRVYLALKRIVEKYSLRALTVRCFDLITKLNTTACLALALLNDEGVVAGCESDVLATLAMVIGSGLSGKPCFMANPVSIRGRRVILAHCTVPFTITSSRALDSHFESGIGVGVVGSFKVGEKVTLLRLHPTLKVLRAIVGTITRSGPWSRDLCRTHLEVESSVDLHEVIVDRSMGNHYVLCMGDLSTEVKYFAKLKGLELELLR